MTVTQEPTLNSLYFQKNIPDIILTKNSVDTSVMFELKRGDNTILQETYVYDANDSIRIRNLFEIVEKYLNSENLLLDFSYIITEGATTHESTFKVLKCDAFMTVEAEVWTKLNFLTRSFLEKNTSKSRNEYLSFLQKSAYAAVTVHYKIFYQTGSTVSDKSGELTTIAASVSDKVTTFNASISGVMMAAELESSVDVIRYDIWLTGTDFETYVYTFLIDSMPYRYRTNFVYENAFGVLETFTATGITNNDKKAEFNQGNIENNYRKVSQDFIVEKTCKSGYLSAEEMEWTDDFVKSYNVGLYTPGVTGMSEEITLVSIEKNGTNGNTLQAFSFTYRSARNIHLSFANASRGIFDDTFDETFD